MKKITLLIASLVFFLVSGVHAQITTYPYLEDFESGDGGWVADNTTNGSWALGTPAAPTINSAASGANAWSTNLTGSYNTNEDSWVTSPVFDLSSLAAPSVEFNIWWNSEFSWDGLVLQSSIDNGTSWQNVGAVGDPNNWYTDGTINGNPGGQQEGWTGRGNTNGSQGWVVARHALTGLAGQSNVILRFAFGSDGSVQDDGVAFDDVSIFDVSCPEPLNLAVNGVTADSADVSWAAGGTETSWEIAIQTAGTGIPAGAGTSTTTNAPYDASGLTPSTNYEVYVRANCGADGFSNWVGPVNFTTLNLPPPAPVGVTCNGGMPSFIFTEDFEDNPPLGWTGTGFDGTNGNWDIAAGNGNSGGTGPFASFSGGTHLEYEASGNSTTTATAISPAIDLTTAVDGAELSFYLHAFGDDIGTLNVGIANAAAGPFTNIYTWIGDLQTADNDAWVPVGINLDAYLGQTVFIQFEYGGAGTGFEGDLSIDLMRVEACGSFCIAPSGLTATNVTNNSVDLGWTANSGETAWEYVVQPAGTGAPAGAGTGTTMNPVTVNGLTPETDYEVYVRAICGPGDASTWAGPINFTTGIEVDCAAAPLNATYCYGNNDTTSFTYFSSDNTSTLSIAFNAGQIEDFFDQLVIIDSDGTVLYDDDNGGDLAGLTFESSGPSITVEVDSDGSVSCQSSGFVPWDYTITCVDPTAPPTCVSLLDPVDGATGIDIIGGNITWGTATNNPAGYILTVGTTPGGTDVLNGQDVGNVTTFALGDLQYDTTYYVTVLAYNGNGLATGCTEESFTTRPDPNQVFNLVCANGPIMVNHCYTNNDDNTFLFSSDTGFPIRLSFTAGTFGDDDDIITIYDGSDNTFPVLFTGNNNQDLTGLVVESSGGNIYIDITSDGFVSCDSGASTPWEWTAECLTCFRPTATYTPVDDCSVANYFIDVEITDTGDAMSITITDDQGSPAQVATAVGVYTFGPYPSQTPVIFTVADTDDTNCVLTSPEIRTTCPDLLCSMPVNAGFDTLQTCDVDSTNLSAVFLPSTFGIPDTTSYTFEPLNCPPEDLTGGTGISLPIDDSWSDVITLPFEFSFYGGTYTELVISANGAVSFDTALAGTFSNWQFNDPLPTVNLPNPAILPFFNDIDPSVGGTISYVVVGTAPFRQFKVNYTDVPLFSCNDLTVTAQIILYESTNIIDVAIIQKPICANWNDGNSVIGIQNDGATQAFFPPERNTGPWEITEPELWRFVPEGAANYTFEWFDEDGNSLGNDPNITVSPTEDTVYTATITYALPDGSLATESDDVLVTVQRTPQIIATETLFACDINFSDTGDFDLTAQDSNVIGTQTGVTVSYYETMADAEAGTDMLADPTSYISGNTTVYVRIEDDVTGCYSTGDFQIELFQLIDPANIGLEGECVNGEYTITVSPLNNGFDPATVTYEWSGGTSTDNDGSQFIATEDGEYTVTVISSEGCASTQTFTVMNAMCSFPQGISPNGDGLNDSWDLRAFRVQELEIFNSHGRSIYKKFNYTNEWVGQTNDNDDLPVGTYFYVLRLENGEARSGWVYLNN